MHRGVVVFHLVGEQAARADEQAVDFTAPVMVSAEQNPVIA
jgi:hypothetical protein